MPRLIDHLVLPTADLDVARARLDALGFTVAPEGAHPFGTKNACIYFLDDTFLESLAIGDLTQVETACEAGNVFVSRDRKFRETHGAEGFSAVVMTSSDADADHAGFRAAGISAGQRLDFSRAYVDANGGARTVSFRLAFAAPADMHDTFFFTCERVNAPASGRGDLAVHVNAVRGLARVVAVASSPRAYDSFLSSFADRAAETGDGELLVRAGNTSLTVLSPNAMASRFQLAPPKNNGFELAGVVFSSSNLAQTASALDIAGVNFHQVDEMIVVPPAPGQGAFFAFEDATS